MDESFLARMMRPTQASSSKTTDKVPLTPPRRPNAGSKRSESGRLSSNKTSSSGSPEATRKITPVAKMLAPKTSHSSIAEEVEEMPLKISTEKIIAPQPSTKHPEPVFNIQTATPTTEQHTEEPEAASDVPTLSASEATLEEEPEEIAEQASTESQVEVSPKDVTNGRVAEHMEETY